MRILGGFREVLKHFEAFQGGPGDFKVLQESLRDDYKGLSRSGFQSSIGFRGLQMTSDSQCVVPIGFKAF